MCIHIYVWITLYMWISLYMKTNIYPGYKIGIPYPRQPPTVRSNAPGGGARFSSLERGCRFLFSTQPLPGFSPHPAALVARFSSAQKPIAGISISAQKPWRQTRSSLVLHGIAGDPHALVFRIVSCKNSHQFCPSPERDLMTAIHSSGCSRPAWRLASWLDKVLDTQVTLRYAIIYTQNNLKLTCSHTHFWTKKIKNGF